MPVPMDGGQRRDFREIETDRDESERIDAHIDRVADRRRAGRNDDGGISAERHGVSGAFLDLAAFSRERDIRRADRQRRRSIFIRKHDAHAGAADAEARRLANGLLPQVGGDAERHGKVRSPCRLRARRPGADPVAGVRGARGGRESNNGGERDRETCRAPIDLCRNRRTAGNYIVFHVFLPQKSCMTSKHTLSVSAGDKYLARRGRESTHLIGEGAPYLAKASSQAGAPGRPRCVMLARKKSDLNFRRRRRSCEPWHGNAMNRVGLRSLFVLAALALATISAFAGQSSALCAAAKKPVEGDPPLAAAVAAAFGKATFKATGEDCVYPLKVLPYASAEVLVVQAGEPGQACHGCGAPVSAYVLRRVDGGLETVRIYRKFATPGDVWRRWRHCPGGDRRRRRHGDRKRRNVSGLRLHGRRLLRLSRRPARPASMIRQS